jgi:aspartokinase/homoserine dehydrogenase 1
MLDYRGAPASADDLVPAHLRRLPLPVFLKRLGELDESWRIRCDAEAAHGRHLRYVVTATAHRVSAGLVAVPASSTIGSAEGTRNIIAFHSARYRKEPLVISGPGAGPAVTAAGIFNDICSLASR